METAVSSAVPTTDPTTMDTDVLICGAGPCGLALALVLARQGVHFQLLDKAPQAFHGSRGKGLQPRTLEIFEDLEVLAPVLAAGGPYPVQRKHAADGSWLDTPTVESSGPTPAEPYAAPLMLPQFMTEAILRERLQQAGQQVAFGCELQGFTQDADGVTAQLADGRRLRARYLIGADGGRSLVRHVLDIGFPGKSLGARAVVADLTLSGLDRSAWHRFGAGSMAHQLSLCPLAGTPLFQLQAPVPLEGEVDLSAAGLTRLIAQRSGRDDIIASEVHWASAYSMSARLAERYRVGRVLLAGDAAHVHPPTGGQGLNTSIQDAYNLGWKLAAVLAGADAALLDTYEQERRPIAEAMLGLSTRLLDAARQGDLRRGRDVQQLDLGYAGSALAWTADDTPRVLGAGQRAPDAPLQTRAGQDVRLFTLYRGPHWTLVGWQVPHLPAAINGLQVHGVGGDGALVDGEGHFAQAYGLAPGEMVLVRPDGYVGAIVEAGQWPQLLAWLARYRLLPGLSG